MSLTAILTFVVTIFSMLFAAVSLWRIGSQLEKIRLEESSSTLLFQIFHLRSFTILYVILFGVYTFTPWFIISMYHL